MGKYDIYMVRHGESEWNDKNLFCGWYDAVLSERGTFFFFFINFYLKPKLLGKKLK